MGHGLLPGNRSHAVGMAWGGLRGSCWQPAASCRSIEHIAHLVMGGRTRNRGWPVKWAAANSSHTVATAAGSSRRAFRRERSGAASGAAVAGCCMLREPCPLLLGPPAAARSSVVVALVCRGPAARRGRAAPARMCVDQELLQARKGLTARGARCMELLRWRGARWKEDSQPALHTHIGRDHDYRKHPCCLVQPL